MSSRKACAEMCTGCGVVFPPNKELASVPRARLIAFDPSANRVWRICEPCGEWNLCGPEASRAAMPELLARTANAATAGEAGLGMVAAWTSTLLLFRVGASPSRDALHQKATEIHSAIEDGHRLTWRGGFSVLGFIALGGGIIWALEQFDASAALLASDAMKAFYWSLMVSRFALAGKELFRRNPKVFKWLGIILIPGLVWALAGSAEPLWDLLVAAGIGTSLGLYWGRKEGKPRGIRWSDGTDAITYHDGIEGDHTGWSATTLALYELQRDFAERVKTEDRDAAWDLWQSHGSLAELLAAFQSRRDSTGLLRFSDMELRERLALLIAIGARLSEPPRELIEGLAEAERVAAIAESLALRSD